MICGRIVSRKDGGGERLTELELAAFEVRLESVGFARVGVEGRVGLVARFAPCSIVVICRPAKC